MNPSVHARVRTAAGMVSLEDITANDAPRIAEYYLRPDPHLDTLIDRSKLAPLPEMTAMIAAAQRSGNPDQMRVAFALRLAGRLIGFTALYRQTADVNFSHWHIVDESLRASGLSTALYPHRMKMYFDLYPIECLIHQTRTSNAGVNRMLDKFVPVAKTEYVQNPDGFAKPGEFHFRYVRRGDLPRILERGAFLRDLAVGKG